MKREQIDALFERNTVAEVLPSREALTERLLSGKPFHIYLGLDPTAAQLHLGHVQNILFLEDLCRLGAHATLLFGSFTCLIGDPSDRTATRPRITHQDIARNIAMWRSQVAPIISRVRIRENREWFDLFSFEDCVKLLREVTVQQLTERDMFQKRIASGKPLYAHELVYPVLQGYDSVAMRVDAELCGTDQTFNALVGTQFVKRFLGKEKYIVAMRLIEGDGVLMSKSSGTGVFIDMHPGGEHRMFGALMALPDSFILPLFRGCTRVPMEQIAALEKTIAGGAGTAVRDAKCLLAETVVGLFHGADKARRARDDFIAQFQKGETPTHAKRIQVSTGTRLLDVIKGETRCSSAEAKRLIREGAVSLDDTQVTDPTYTFREAVTYTLHVGRTVFIVTVTSQGMSV